MHGKYTRVPNCKSLSCRVRLDLHRGGSLRSAVASNRKRKIYLGLEVFPIQYHNSGLKYILDDRYKGYARERPKQKHAAWSIHIKPPSTPHSPINPIHQPHFTPKPFRGSGLALPAPLLCSPREGRSLGKLRIRIHFFAQGMCCGSGFRPQLKSTASAEFLTPETHLNTTRISLRLTYLPRA